MDHRGEQPDGRRETASVSPQDLPGTLRLSNRDVPERERLAYLHDFVARGFAGLRFTPEGMSDFTFDVAWRPLDDETALGTARYAPLRGERTRELTGDGRNNYMLTVHDTDFESKAGTGTLRIARGDLFLINESERHSFTLPATQLMAVTLAPGRMVGIAPAIRLKPFHHVPADAPAAALVTGYMRLLLSQPGLEAPAARIVGQHLHQLAGLAIGAQADGPTALSATAGARLALIREDVKHNLADPDLDIGFVARRQGVTPRYVQRLFERDGTSFSRFLRDARLDLARAALEDSDGRSISAIAYDCGFGDLSNFNKTFRQRFGVTPRDIRASILRRAP